MSLQYIHVHVFYICIVNYYYQLLQVIQYICIELTFTRILHVHVHVHLALGHV